MVIVNHHPRYRHSGEGRNPVPIRNLALEYISSHALTMQKLPFVYIMASQKNGTLYIGVTSNLPQRAWQHQSGTVEGFSKDNKTTLLVYYEAHGTMEAAIVREKQLKDWHRLWKIRIIEEMNPNWDDLYERLNQ